VSTLSGKVMTHIERSDQIGKAMSKNANLFDQAYQLEEIEKQARPLSMIDREIDKLIKRFVYLKEFENLESNKRAIPATYIEGPSVTPGNVNEVNEQPATDEPAARTTPDKNNAS
jgi:hypothetical protein